MLAIGKSSKTDKNLVNFEKEDEENLKGCWPWGVVRLPNEVLGTEFTL